MRLATVRSAAAIAMLVIVATGCDDADPPPEPDPRYEQIPRHVCHRLPVEEVAERFGLTVVPWYDPRSDYRTERTHWYESCSFTAEDERFAPEFDHFQPDGGVRVEVYYEEAEAEERYQRDADGYLRRIERIEEGATTAEMTGWWDQGLSLESVKELDPDLHNTGDLELSQLLVVHLVRHENLVVRGGLQVTAPTEEADEVLALLHDLVEALIDEAVAQLTLTE